MVTKNAAGYSYSLNGSTTESATMKPGRYWDNSNLGPSDRENYADHLRSSSYHVLQQHMGSSNSSVGYHSRQPSSTSNYSEFEELSGRNDQQRTVNNKYPVQYPVESTPDRSRYLSYDSIGPEMTNQKYHSQYNLSEPDLTGSPHEPSQNSVSYYSPNSSSHNNYYQRKDGQNCNSMDAHNSSSSLHSNFANSSFNSGQSSGPPPPLRKVPNSKNPSSPPPPPVRDASSLKYIKYGPGHEKFPSWPVPAGNAGEVINSVTDNETSTLSESLTAPHGSHRSKSWTEQSDYPKDTSGGYTRPHHKKHLNPLYQHQLKTVMEKSEKIYPHVYESKMPEELLSNPNDSLLDYFCKNNPSYPLYDRDGHGIDDKDYNIPSPPERDPGMGHAFSEQLHDSQLEEYGRSCDYSYSGIQAITPLLDKLREESAGWDGGSEKDSGRGESEGMAESLRYSNGRDSVTTVVTNSSSASSSETLKWHGSLSDISIMSGQSRDLRAEQNIAHSARVLAPQRHNSESILYYGSDKNGKPIGRYPSDHRVKDSLRRDSLSKDSRWTKEVERNNEANVKKFPSYSYTQPLSQINEAPIAESREMHSSNLKVTSPTVDVSKPPSVAERICQIERQSRTPQKDLTQKLRDTSEPRERARSRDNNKSLQDLRQRDMSEPRGEFNESDVDTSCNSSVVDNRKSPPRPSNTVSNVLNQIDPRSDSSTKRNIIRNPSISSKDISKPVHPTSSENSPPILQDQENIPHMSPTYSAEDSDNPPLKHFAYLDPKKQCKVPDSTLKNIQKRALMSFYERRTGKGRGSLPEGGTSLAPKHSFNSSSSSIRESKSGLAGVSLARLGRVPDSDTEASPSRPPRKRSIHGRPEKNKSEEEINNKASISLDSSAVSFGGDASPPQSANSNTVVSTQMR